jgi:hypothetical protein
MSTPDHTTITYKNTYRRADTTPPVDFADPETDWIQVEKEAEIKLEVWSRLIGFYTAHAKRESEIIQHAQAMQRTDNKLQYCYSVNQSDRGNYAEN